MLARSPVSGGAKFERLLKDMSSQEIDRTRLEETIDYFRNDDNVPRGMYVVYPFWEDDHIDWGICLVNHLPDENIPNTIAVICKRYPFDYDPKSFFSSSDEQQLKKARKGAELSEIHGESDSWEIYRKKADRLDTKEEESRKEKTMIIDKAEKIWAELLEQNLLELFLNH